jgi:hypothetical protein
VKAATLHRSDFVQQNAANTKTNRDERLDGNYSTRNFHICYACVRTKRGRRPDGWSRIGNFLNWWACIWTKADWCPDSDLPHRPDGWSIFPLLELGKNLRLFEYWYASGWTAEMSERMQARTEASRYSVGSGRKRCIVQTDDDGLSGVRSGWTLRSYGWNSGQMGVRTGWHVVQTTDRESEIFYFFRSTESSENALTSGIPVYNIFTLKLFCPNTKWGQNTNKLPLWPFWDKNHLTGLEIQSRSKN